MRYRRRRAIEFVRLDVALHRARRELLRSRPIGWLLADSFRFVFIWGLLLGFLIGFFFALVATGQPIFRWQVR